MGKFVEKDDVSRKEDGPGAPGRDKASGKKKTALTKDQQLEAEDIARAVYDGMQDLRVKKFKP